MKKKILSVFLFVSIVFAPTVNAQTNKVTKKSSISISMIEEIKTNYYSHIYLNSLTNKLSVDFKEKKTPITLKLSSENGVLVYSKEVAIDENMIEFETSSLKQGSYTIVFFDQNNQSQKKYQININL